MYLALQELSFFTPESTLNRQKYIRTPDIKLSFIKSRGQHLTIDVGQIYSVSIKR